MIDISIQRVQNRGQILNGRWEGGVEITSLTFASMYLNFQYLSIGQMYECKISY